MKLLIIAQKVDVDDPILGFFHGWIKQFSGNFEKTTVICLEKGKNELSPDIKVLSLGKEKKRSRLSYIFNFYFYIWKERKNYDAVFVHMNQEYVLLAGWIWRLLGKMVVMWRNHYDGSIFTDISSIFCHKIFCTSAYSYTAKYKKTVLMPVGIDTDIFKPIAGVNRLNDSILFLGRISPSKKVHMLVEALSILNDSGIDFTASVYGNPSSRDINYYESVKDRARSAGLSQRVSFYPGVPNHDTPGIYSRHEVFINLSSSGMFDKTIFEAGACGAIPVSCSKDLAGKVDDLYIFKEDDPKDLAMKIVHLFSMGPEEMERRRLVIRGFTEKNHSLHKLTSSLVEEISKP